LENAPIVVKAKVGATGSLFGSVTEKDLIAAIKSSVGIDIDRHRLKAPAMKKLGNFTAKVNLHTQVSANIQVQVVAA
jgi:large subunit ribosomal protein L9